MQAAPWWLPVNFSSWRHPNGLLTHITETMQHPVTQVDEPLLVLLYVEAHTVRCRTVTLWPSASGQCLAADCPLVEASGACGLLTRHCPQRPSGSSLPVEASSDAGFPGATS